MEIDDALVLKPLFDLLNRRTIRYAVLRNAEPLPARANDGDIDMLIHPADFDRGLAAIEEAIRASGGSILARAQSPHFRQVMAVGRCGGAWWGLSLDLFSDVRYKGVAPLLDLSALEERVLTASGVYALNDEVGGLLGVVKELAYNGVLAPRYLEDAKRALASEGALRHFSCLGRRAIESLRLALAQAPTESERRRLVARFRRSLMRGAVARGVWRCGVGLAGFYACKAWRVVAPAGKVVAVLGTDGAGKSTVLEALRPLMARATHRAYIVHHLKPDLLPPLARLKGKQVATRGPVVDPHGSSPSGTAGSLFRLAYLLVDYVFGYWLKVVPQTAKIPSALYVFDRYAYDLALDPRRFRISLPTGLIRLAIKCVPRPDVVVCLVGDPRVLAERKRELPLSEVARQVEALTRFALSEPRAVLVSTTQPLDETCREVVDAICGRSSLSNSHFPKSA